MKYSNWSFAGWSVISNTECVAVYAGWAITSDPEWELSLLTTNLAISAVWLSRYVYYRPSCSERPVIKRGLSRTAKRILKKQNDANRLNVLDPCAEKPEVKNIEYHSGRMLTLVARHWHSMVQVSKIDNFLEPTVQ